MTELLEELDYMNSRLKVWQEACIKLIRTISYIRMNAYRLNVNSSCLACTPVLQASIHRKDNVYLGRAQITHLRWFNITSRCQYIIKLLAGHFSEKKASIVRSRQNRKTEWQGQWDPMTPKSSNFTN